MPDARVITAFVIVLATLATSACDRPARQPPPAPWADRNDRPDDGGVVDSTAIESFELLSPGLPGPLGRRWSLNRDGSSSVFLPRRRREQDPSLPYDESIAGVILDLRVSQTDIDAALARLRSFPYGQELSTADWLAKVDVRRVDGRTSVTHWYTRSVGTLSQVQQILDQLSRETIDLYVEGELSPVRSVTVREYLEWWYGESELYLLENQLQEDAE